MWLRLRSFEWFEPQTWSGVRLGTQILAHFQDMCCVSLFEARYTILALGIKGNQNDTAPFWSSLILRQTLLDLSQNPRFVGTVPTIVEG